MKHTNLILLLLALSFLACNRTPDMTNKDDRVRVKVVGAEFNKINEAVRTSGQLSSKTEVRLSFKTGGLIEQISVKEGQSVLQGDVLARLNLAEVNAMEHQADLAFKKADRDYARVENLYNDSVATLENLQDALTGLDIAKANLDIARFNRKYSVIEAPAQGKILKKLAEESEIVGPGQPIFLFGSSGDEWVVKASLTDRDVVKIELGDPAVIHFDAFPDVDFQSVVSEIGRAADPYTGTYEVKLSLTPQKYPLASGFVARVEIYTPQPVLCLQIPIEALVEAQGDVGYIFIARDNRAEKRQIRISNTNGIICIQEGVEEGELIITEGANYLKESDEIVILEN
ncbi:MAG: efflux RND transporter periplasmic adaptor subunit [Bacteroidales bacterium]|nr:efflux RND transporter periplasmic adaptor subunit [Bacteroidales bacterium]